jgi:AmmeMemoRadiSam system protein A
MEASREALDRDEREFLLDAARRTIIEHTENGAKPAYTSDKPRLCLECGAFVTLREKGGALRGCIGHVEPTKPLLQTVVDMAVACSCRDPRFRPVTPDELPDLELEISVLTPLEEIHEPNAVCIGLHGLMIKKGCSSGLLLPQVATDCKWDRHRFLDETCRKAGLRAGDWKADDARLFVFSAQIFGGCLI